MSKPDYPKVRCDHHRHRPEVSGYLVCLHVMQRERQVAVHEAPTKKEIGVLVCAQCDEDLQARNAQHVTLACLYCVTERHLIPN